MISPSRLHPPLCAILQPRHDFNARVLTIRKMTGNVRVPLCLTWGIECHAHVFHAYVLYLMQSSDT